MWNIDRTKHDASGSRPADGREPSGLNAHWGCTMYFFLTSSEILLFVVLGTGLD
jgi:hypothetical protein